MNETPETSIRRADRPLWLGLFSLAGVTCCLTWTFAPFAAVAGVLLGITDVLESRKQGVGKNRALLGLGCSLAACGFWLWLLGFTNWNESGYN